MTRREQIARVIAPEWAWIDWDKADPKDCEHWVWANERGILKEGSPAFWVLQSLEAADRLIEAGLVKEE